MILKNISYICQTTTKIKKVNPKFYKITFFFILLLCGRFNAQNTQVDSLKRVVENTKIDTVKVNQYNKIADLYKEVNPDSTFLYAQKAMVISLKKEYHFGLATAYVNKGNASIILGNYPDALKFFKSAQSEFEIALEKEANKKRIKSGLARSYASSGVVYSEQGDYTLSLKNYEKGLKLYQEIEELKGVSKTLNNIGILYKSQQKYPKALQYLKEAHKIQIVLGEQNAPITLTNIGVIYFETGEYQNAIQYYQKAQKGFEKNENKRGSALLNNYLGDYYTEQKNFPLADQYYQKSLALYEEIQNKFGASLALYNIGLLLQEQKKYEEAVRFATKSLEYAQEIGVLDQTYHSEELLSELYESLKKPEAALVHYKNSIIARDSISNQETSKKFAVAEMNYEYKKKEALLSEKHKREFQLVIFLILGGFLLIALGLVIYNRM